MRKVHKGKIERPSTAPAAVLDDSSELDGPLRPSEIYYDDDSKKIYYKVFTKYLRIIWFMVNIGRWSLIGMHAGGCQGQDKRKSHTNSDLKKKTGSIEQTIVCTRQNLKPGYFDRRHLFDTTQRATALELRFEDY